MATAVAIPPSKSRHGTVAELVRDLGDIPLSRILLTPSPGTATEADQLRMCESGDCLVELIDGTLVEKAMGAREGFMAVTLIILLGNFVRKQNLGIVGGADVIHRIIDGQNRLPDVSFTAWDTLPEDDAHLQPIADCTPDLCIEILSESNTRKEMDRKRKEYFRGGAKLVWEIEPEDRTVAVYTSPARCKTLRESDTLDGGKVLPGFAMSLAEFFAEPQLNSRPAKK